MLAKIKEAERLMNEALALLDEAGELRAAPHLDMALHELRQSGSTVAANDEIVPASTH